MKKLTLQTLAFASLALATQAQTLVNRVDGLNTVIGGWDFNGGTATTVASVNARYNQQYNNYFTAGNITTPGSALYGTVYFTTTAGFGASFGTNRPLASATAPQYPLGTTGLLGANDALGEQSTNARSIVLSDNVTSDAGRAVFKIDTITTFDLFTGINVAYSARNAGTADATISWSYSLNGGTSFTPIAGSADTIIQSGATFNVYAADFSSVLALEGVNDLLIGLEYSEAGAAANVFLDNVAFYGTAGAIPEPSSFAALAGLVGLGFAASRRRRA